MNNQVTINMEPGVFNLNIETDRHGLIIIDFTRNRMDHPCGEFILSLITLLAFDYKRRCRTTPIRLREIHDILVELVDEYGDGLGKKDVKSLNTKIYKYWRWLRMNANTCYRVECNGCGNDVSSAMNALFKSIHSGVDTCIWVDFKKIGVEPQSIEIKGIRGKLLKYKNTSLRRVNKTSLKSNNKESPSQSGKSEESHSESDDKTKNKMETKPALIKSKYRKRKHVVKKGSTRFVGTKYVKVSSVLAKPETQGAYSDEEAVLRASADGTVFAEINDPKAGYKYITEELPKYISNAREKHKYITLILIDIDALGQINKTHKFYVGSKVIEKMAHLVYSYFGKASYIRCGDDTFFTLINGMTTSKVFAICSEFVEFIYGFDWQKYSRDLWVTCSIGLATLIEEESPVDLIIRAKDGMVAARKNGGNQVKVGPDRLSATYKQIQEYTFSGGSTWS